MQGAHRVHFQDFNAEVLTSLTIPNVAANLAQARSMPRRVSEVNVPTVSRTPNPAVEVKFFAGTNDSVFCTDNLRQPLSFVARTGALVIILTLIKDDSE